MNLEHFNNSGFDRGASRLKEALWVMIKCTFFLSSFPFSSAFRVFLLRLFGAKIGKNFVIRSGVNITFPWRFKAGDHVWIGEGTLILSLAPVTLGSNVCVSQRTFLCTGSHDYRSTTFDLIAKPIEIHDRCWIGAMAFVGPGVEVKTGCIVGAGAVVVRSAPEKSLVIGNPAQIRSIS